MAEREGIYARGSGSLEALDLGILSRWINGLLESDSAVPRSTLVRQNGAALLLAEELGIIRQAGTATELACTVCAEDPHSCRVVHAPEGHYRYRCPFSGWIEVSQDDLSLLAFDRRSLLAALAAAAGDKPDKIRLFADNRLARVAFIKPSCLGRPWCFGYADRLENENVQAGIIDALATQFPKGPGLIATPSFVPMNFPLPKDYRLVALHELVFGRGNELVIDHAAAEIRLGRSKKASGQPGRPSLEETCKRLWHTLRLNSDWPDLKKDQAEFILEHWPEDEPEQPKTGTIENQIRKFQREAKGATG